MKKLIYFSAFILPFVNAQAAQLNCEYSFGGVSMGTVKLALDENGLPGADADVSLFFTPTRKMPVTNVTPGAGEVLRLYLSKDDPNNEILMTVKASEGGVMKSVLLNASAPTGIKELPGLCNRI